MPRAEESLDTMTMMRGRPLQGYAGCVRSNRPGSRPATSNSLPAVQICTAWRIWARRGESELRRALL